VKGIAAWVALRSRAVEPMRVKRSALLRCRDGFENFENCENCENIERIQTAALLSEHS
jgi:phosphohistidine phosphatase SixA